MSSEKSDENKLSRRNFIKGAGVGAAVGAVAVAGFEEGIRLPGMQIITPQLVTVSLSASPTAAQAGSPVQFSVTPGGGTPPYAIALACGDGTTLTAAGSHTYTAAGNYTALVTVTDTAGAKAQATVALVVSGGGTTAAQPLSQSVVTMLVNGESKTVLVESRDTLLDTLREKLGLTGAKRGCNEATCGACMVSIDGKPYLSCTTLAIECDGRSIQTIESFTSNADTLKILNQFYASSGYQCGFCAPGFEVATKLLLDRNPKPTADQIRKWFSGNLCRCGSYNHIVDAVLKLGGS